MGGITVIVIGAGNFGRHYIRILSGRHGTENRTLPEIASLVVTRTRLSAAREISETWFSKTDDITIIPEKVASSRELSDVLHRHRPHLSCITAFDRVRGEAIHADYSEIAMAHGSVLCEKPFCSATGDGASLQRLAPLLTHENQALFGLELPLAVIRNALMAHHGLADRLLNARHLHFSWGAVTSMKTSLMDNLALHPWSLIPRFLTPLSLSAMENRSRATIRGKWYNARTEREVDIVMNLNTASNFRGLQIDDLPLFFHFEKTTFNVCQLPVPIDTAREAGTPPLLKKPLLSVPNPLAQHIAAALDKRPLVDIKQTLASQQFLEMTHGYTPRG